MDEYRIKCKMCGHYFIGHHNSMYCADCKVVRAKYASHRTWEMSKRRRKMNLRKELGRTITDFEISAIDGELAQKAGKNLGAFQIWKFTHEDEYKAMLVEKGYTYLNGKIYKKEADSILPQWAVVLGFLNIPSTEKEVLTKYKKEMKRLEVETGETGEEKLKAKEQALNDAKDEALACIRKAANK